MNSYGSEDQELGNREIFEKMTKCSKLSRFAKPKKKVISRPDSLNKPVIKINVSTIKEMLSFRLLTKCRTKD